jgi:hypothetical protein
MLESQNPVFLQAMGWCAEEKGRVARSKVASSEDEMPVNLVGT